MVDTGNTSLAHSRCSVDVRYIVDTEQIYHRHIQQKCNYSRRITGAYTEGLMCANSGSRMSCMGFTSLWDPFHWGGLWWEFRKTSSFLSLSPFSFLSDTAELCFLSGGWRLILLWSEGWWVRLGGLGVVPEPVLSLPHPLLCHRSLEFTFFSFRVCCGLFKVCLQVSVGLFLDS